MQDEEKHHTSSVQEPSSIAEDIVADFAGIMPEPSEEHTTQPTSPVPQPLPTRVYTQLELCIQRGSEPPEWILNLVMTSNRGSLHQQAEDINKVSADKPEIPSTAQSPSDQVTTAPVRSRHVSNTAHSRSSHPTHVNTAAHSPFTRPAQSPSSLANQQIYLQTVQSHEARCENAPIPRSLTKEFGIRTPLARNDNASPSTSSFTPTSQVHDNSLASPMIDQTGVAAQTTEAAQIDVATRPPLHFVMKQSDLSKDLGLTGKQTEDVVEILTHFRARVRLNSTDGSSEAIVEQRAIKYLPLLVRDAAANSLQQLL